MRTMLLLAMTTGCVVEVGGGEDRWSLDDPREVVIQVGSGDIEVYSSSDGLAYASWEGGGFGDNASPDLVELPDGRFLIDANGGILGGGSLSLEVPAGTALDLSVERGAIDVALDAPSDVSACVAAGSITLGMPPGPYAIDVGIGIGVIDSEIWNEPDAPYAIDVCVAAGDVEIYAR